ncbi:Maob [Symbiodinium necroappetens]|uniref:Amine oxidase n=1 Tax=Symbiodinium necroappetens TaxID=1628268 RepID=A0A812TJ62_9DINO|nr:Maob [Symbiodinium necroappetens]
MVGLPTARSCGLPGLALLLALASATPDVTCTSRSLLQKHSDVGAAAGALQAAAYSAVDVAIVGAGYAGLSIARELQKANVSFRLFEARHRIGGRILDEDLNKQGKADDVIELGGQWLHDTHTGVLSLLKDLGFELYEPGQQLGSQKFPCGGTCPERVSTSRGWLNTSSMHGRMVVPMTMEESTAFEEALAAVTEDISNTPCTEPLSHPKAKLFDSLSYSAYLREYHKLDAFPNVYSKVADQCLEAEAAKNVSALHCLWKASCNGGLRTGSVQYRVRGGPQAPLQHLAAQLPHAALHLDASVSAIKQSKEHRELKVLVTNTSVEVLARHVVLAGLPPRQILGIQFEPNLPEEVVKLLHGLSLGSIRKYSLVYKTPWWRAKGYSGSLRYVNYSLPSFDAQRCFDNSPYSGSHGVLTCMTTGDVNRGLESLSKEARFETLQGMVQEALGPPGKEDRSPRVVEKDWSEDARSGGANVFYSPGAFASSWPGTSKVFFHHLLDKSIWIAGADYSSTSHGYMDGAIRTGQAVAKLLVQKLRAS